MAPPTQSRGALKRPHLFRWRMTSIDNVCLLVLPPKRRGSMLLTNESAWLGHGYVFCVEFYKLKSWDGFRNCSWSVIPVQQHNYEATELPPSSQPWLVLP